METPQKTDVESVDAAINIPEVVADPTPDAGSKKRAREADDNDDDDGAEEQRKSKKLDTKGEES